jgi:hypothetical protein
LMKSPDWMLRAVQAMEILLGHGPRGAETMG